MAYARRRGEYRRDIPSDLNFGEEFPDIRMLIGVVVLALGAAAIPAAPGILELGDPCGSIVEQGVYDAKLARDKAAQSVVNFAGA